METGQSSNSIDYCAGNWALCKTNVVLSLCECFGPCLSFSLIWYVSLWLIFFCILLGIQRCLKVSWFLKKSFVRGKGWISVIFLFFVLFWGTDHMNFLTFWIWEEVSIYCHLKNFVSVKILIMRFASNDTLIF